MSTSYILISRVADIPPLGGRCVKTPRGPIGVFRTADDRIFAIDNRCPHKGGPLSEGIVHGTAVTCPLHNTVINLETGEIVGPDEGRVEAIEVRVVDGEIHLALSGRVERQPMPKPAAEADLADSVAAVSAEGRAPPIIPNTATRRVAPKESV